MWPGGGLSTSTDWYRFGMNNTGINNAPSSCLHSFQVKGTQIAYFNSNGLTVPGTIAITVGTATATQTWGQSPSYLTTSPSSITQGHIALTGMTYLSLNAHGAYISLGSISI